MEQMLLLFIHPNEAIWLANTAFAAGRSFASGPRNPLLTSYIGNKNKNMLELTHIVRSSCSQNVMPAGS